MKNLQVFVVVSALILIIIWFFRINYSDLSWRNNVTPFLGIIAMTLLLISQLYSNKNKE